MVINPNSFCHVSVIALLQWYL